MTADPAVVSVAWPETGADQVNQTEAPPVLPAWFGSPVSLVAERFVPVRLPLCPEIAKAEAKLSLVGAGGGVSVQLRLIEPRAASVPPLKPSTAIRYVVPPTAAKLTVLLEFVEEMSSFAAIWVSAETLVPV